MRFIPGVTKLTDFHASLGERPPLNDCLWSVTDDLKIAWGYFTIDDTSVELVNGDGFYSSSFEAEGIFNLVPVSTWDALPAVFVIPILSAGTAASRLYGMAEDGSSYSRSTSAQTVYLLDSTGAVVSDGLSHGVFVMMIGVDADTTQITNNSDQTPLFKILNRIFSIGNYLNPETIENTVPVISVGYTTTTANPGDTLANIANLTNHSRAAAGSYTTDFNANYYLPPMGGLITPLGDAGTPDHAYGVGPVTIETLTTYTTDATNNTKADTNYSMMVIGLMEVS
jgi:hypothetical protein